MVYQVSYLAVWAYSAQATCLKLLNEIPYNQMPTLEKNEIMSQKLPLKQMDPSLLEKDGTSILDSPLVKKTV